MGAGTPHQLMSGVLEGHSSSSVSRQKGLKGHSFYFTHTQFSSLISGITAQPEEVCCRTLPVALEGAWWRCRFRHKTHNTEIRGNFYNCVTTHTRSPPFESITHPTWHCEQGSHTVCSNISATASEMVICPLRCPCIFWHSPWNWQKTFLVDGETAHQGHALRGLLAVILVGKSETSLYLQSDTREWSRYRGSMFLHRGPRRWVKLTGNYDDCHKKEKKKNNQTNSQNIYWSVRSKQCTFLEGLASTRRGGPPLTTRWWCSTIHWK